MIEKKLRL